MHKVAQPIGSGIDGGISQAEGFEAGSSYRTVGCGTDPEDAKVFACGWERGSTGGQKIHTEGGVEVRNGDMQLSWARLL